ncbi:DUF3859 domain-containing protein [Neiella marina]|uniref:DUF3859 domain-containing protein n=1 Tax=Neiella holothuriorum TaxID=2870530 RepID=A0ABS7EJ25_9GAMM|nr:DUF3859 domain-containing protein [Neiella holothuriorum]MBW8192358.1 DUF3859 domain-containing protein [Neiella holothuriorum]
MAKTKFSSRIVSAGIYDGFDASSKQLPKIKSFTRHVLAELDVEFGLIVNISKAKGHRIVWRIEHPNLVNDEGDVMPPFEGEEFISDNDWHFYLGDCIWAPIDDKGGNWRMTIELNGALIVDETFDVEVDEYKVLNDDSFWQGRRRKS